MLFSTFRVNVQEVEHLESVLQSSSPGREGAPRLEGSMLRVASRHGRAVQWARLLSTDAWQVLGIPAGSSKLQIKAAYYDLARRTHPDTRSDGAEAPDASAFLEVQAAFEELISSQGSASAAPTTAANHAARGGAATQRPSQRRGPRASTKVRSLGEVLCDRLAEEPEQVHSLWCKIVERELAVNAYMTDAIFRACARGGFAMPTALSILREGTRRGLLSQSVRSAAITSILCHCKEADLDVTFQLVDEITDARQDFGGAGGAVHHILKVSERVLEDCRMVEELKGGRCTANPTT
eukprot:4375225-Prymnesium_polylepis.1